MGPMDYFSLQTGLYNKINGLPRNVPFFNNWQKLEVLSNILSNDKNPSSAKTGLNDVITERLSPILSARKQFQEVTEFGRFLSVRNPNYVPANTPTMGVWEGVDSYRKQSLVSYMQTAGLTEYISKFN
jgi:hypothetical protein